ncbi:hypothetical protein [Xanthomonas arboricola]|uniref:hypothetical protein n=1 Tax=Xanthomonas arboricola TaxID=56448 RepID=UPI0012D46DAA|nr:hypothetical protein [Xanthomonas arboricola]
MQRNIRRTRMPVGRSMVLLRERLLMGKQELALPGASIARRRRLRLIVAKLLGWPIPAATGQSVGHRPAGRRGGKRARPRVLERQLAVAHRCSQIESLIKTPKEKIT